MILYCERCDRTDGDWKRAIPHLLTLAGEYETVWRHRPCGMLIAVPKVTAQVRR